VSISKVAVTPGSNTNASDFTPVNLCPSSLAPSKSCVIGIIFYAGNVGAVSATLKITDTAAGSPQQITMSATVINPQVKFSPTSLSFGTVKAGHSSTQTVTLSNPGTTALNITAFNLTGSNPSNFAKNTSACPASLAAGAHCAITVTFTPIGTGNRSANLAVTDNALLGTQTVPLSGKGN
jgi:hypothetical protein